MEQVFVFMICFVDMYLFVTPFCIYSLLKFCFSCFIFAFEIKRMLNVFDSANVFDYQLHLGNILFCGPSPVFGTEVYGYQNTAETKE